LKNTEYGLIGKTLTHSFSKPYFEKKFKELGLNDHVYLNFELKEISELKELIHHHPNLRGFNVTIPYKETVMEFLDEVNEEAKAIGAVNCVKIDSSENISAKHLGKKLIGYNTDVFGFASSIKPFLEPQHERALILGTGGSSKAVAYALKRVGVEVYFVSNSKSGANIFSYKQLNAHMMQAFKLIVNTTPLGMFPDLGQAPPIPYEFIGAQHLCYDLIYNPEETMFLKHCKKQGAVTMNGYNMLKLQAEKSWDIWNS
jgi:shikimate dehydrogenase